MLNLAMSELMAGANVWDARGHVMSGSNDLPTRVQIFHWIAQHEDIFGAVRTPVGETGVYFSDATRNLYPNDFVSSYRGVLLLLLQNHVQFRIVTPRTLAQFHGKVLVLPNVKIISDDEVAALHRFAATGGKLVLTGAVDSRLNDLDGVVRFPARPEIDYLNQAQKDFASSDPGSQPELLHAITSGTGMHVSASRNVVVHQARIGSRTYLFFANFDGLQAGAVATPVTQHDIQITAPMNLGTRLHWLPCFGDEVTIVGRPGADGVHFSIPQLDRGGVAWFSTAPPPSRKTP